MTRAFIAACTAAVLTAGTALAVEPEVGAGLGTSASEISQALGESGYDMTKYEREADRIEVHAVKGDQRIEVKVDATTGTVIARESRQRRGPTPRPGVADDQIRTSLEEQGYEILKYERERGEIEVYALREGRRWELKLDPRTGEVLRVEEER